MANKKKKIFLLKLIYTKICLEVCIYIYLLSMPWINLLLICIYLYIDGYFVKDQSNGFVHTGHITGSGIVYLYKN